MTTDAQTPPNRNWLAVALGAVMSIGAMVILFSQVDFNEFTSHLKGVDRGYFIAMIASYPLAIILRTLRWQGLIRHPMSFFRAFHVLNISFLLNTLLPLRLGEVARVVLMSREKGQSAGAGLSALALERLLDLSFALLSVGAGLVLLPESAGLPTETTSTLGFLIVITITGLVVLLFLPRTHPLLIKIAHTITRPLPTGLAHKLNGFVEDTLHGLQTLAEPKRLITALGWTFILWTSYAAYFHLGLIAFIPDAPPIGVGLLTLGFIALGGAAPSLPGAVGVFQAAAVLALTTAGYDTSLATSYAWGVWVPQTILIILTGALSLWAMGISFNRLAHEVREEMAHHELTPGSQQEQQSRSS